MNYGLLLQLAGMAIFIITIGVQYVENEHLKLEIAQIEAARSKAVTEKVTENAAIEEKWSKAATVGFQNYQQVADKTRSTYDRQIAQLKAVQRPPISVDHSHDTVPDSVPAVGVPVSAAPDGGGAMPSDTRAADSQACEDRLAGARATVTGCLDAARAATECEGKLELLYNAWPK